MVVGAGDPAEMACAVLFLVAVPKVGDGRRILRGERGIDDRNGMFRRGIDGIEENVLGKPLVKSKIYPETQDIELHGCTACCEGNRKMTWLCQSVCAAGNGGACDA